MAAEGLAAAGAAAAAARAGAAMNPDDMARMRDAMRDLINPSNHLTIVETDSMVVMTSADGRTTRLSPDGKKNQGRQHRNRAQDEMGRRKARDRDQRSRSDGKATQTIAADPESHQLRIVLQMEGGRQAGGGQAAAGNSAQGRGPRTITHVYDDDKYTK